MLQSCPGLNVIFADARKANEHDRYRNYRRSVFNCFGHRNIIGVFKNKATKKKGLTAVAIANTLIESVERFEKIKQAKPEAKVNIKSLIKSLATAQGTEPDLNRFVRIVTEPYKDQDLER